ncbi:hypothetical protein LIER_16119 [Lithospermum erythrorhizon]|uniref:Uncharacterized protein n=1 Tax=Lithospermum erythrorhizon TaxID=34254 RepID=A0AAV3Q6D1_LITER
MATIIMDRPLLVCNFLCAHLCIYTILLSNMAYTEDDEAFLDAEDDAIANIWNLRKCNTTALDILSNVFGDQILLVLMPIVQVTSKAFLLTPGDKAWQAREAAFLALGAIIEGRINGLYPLGESEYKALANCAAELSWLVALLLARKELLIQFISTKDQITDVLTKPPLSTTRFGFFRDKLRLFSRPPSACKGSIG